MYPVPIPNAMFYRNFYINYGLFQIVIKCKARGDPAPELTVEAIVDPNKEMWEEGNMVELTPSENVDIEMKKGDDHSVETYITVTEEYETAKTKKYRCLARQPKRQDINYYDSYIYMQYETNRHRDN